MKLFIPVLLVLMAAIVGCTNDPSAVPADPSYATDVQSIFNNHCMSCHGSSGPQAGYSLASRAGALGTGSDTVPNVIAGNAASSKLYRRVTGIETPQMPLSGAPLDTVMTGTIRNWIDKGAKDN